MNSPILTSKEIVNWFNFDTLTSDLGLDFEVRVKFFRLFTKPVEVIVMSMRCDGETDFQTVRFVGILFIEQSKYRLLLLILISVVGTMLTIIE